MPKIWKDVQGYRMKGNNFVSYSFWLFITLFSRPYGLLDHSGDDDPSPKGLKVLSGLMEENWSWALSIKSY